METLKLRAEYPCCGGKAFVTVIVDVPHERFDRRCSKCNQRWTVFKTELPKLNKNAFVNKLEWTVS